MMRVITFLFGLPLIALCTLGFFIAAMSGFHYTNNLPLTPELLLRNEQYFGFSAFGAGFFILIVGWSFIDHFRRDYRGFFHGLLVIIAMSLLLLVPLGGGLLSIPLARRFIDPEIRPDMVYVLGTVATFFLMCGIGLVTDTVSGYELIRGRTLSSFKQATRKARALLRKQPPEVWWGGLQLPAAAAEANFCVIGTTGSGKSVTLQRVMQSVLPSIQPGSDIRAVLYDAKRDLRSVLDGMGIPEDRIRLLNPFDARSVAWDMAKDIASPAVAEQIAKTLIPVEEGPNRFFSDAARDLLRGAINAYILSGDDRWTLRDIALAMQGEAPMRALLSRHPVTKPLIDQYFGEERTFQNIRSTIATYMAGYSTVAALWANSKRLPLSLTDWLKPGNESILILGNDDSLRAPLDAINRVLFQRISELLLDQPESKSRRTWVILDELKEAGRLDALPRLLTKGRSYGVRVVLGFQDIDGLESLYGHNLPHEILGMCANKAILRLDSHRTAEWAAQTIGKAEVRQFTTSKSSGASGFGHSVSEAIVKREAVIGDELMNMPLPDESGFQGYYIIPAVATYHTRLPFPPRFKERAKEPDFVQRPVREQYLTPPDREQIPVDVPSTVAQPATPSAASPPVPNIHDIRRITRTGATG